jgi:hypothetical protein
VRHYVIANVANQGRALTVPFNTKGVETNMIAYTCFHLYFPWLIDLTLLLRLVAVYPPHFNSIRTSVAVFAFPVVVKLARAIAIGMFCDHFARNIQGNDVFSAFSIGLNTPYGRIEWFLQLFDNT